MIIFMFAIPAVFGLYKLIAPMDVLWDLHEWRSSLSGIETKRTENWERSERLHGFFLVFISVVMGVLWSSVLVL